MSDVTVLPATNVIGQRPVIDHAEQFAMPDCSIEVYPFEGGGFTIDPGQVRSVVMRKSIRNGEPGVFRIVLAPGGPNGVEGSPTWSEVITPVSLVLIGMRRGSNGNIVMVGVANAITETQRWETEEGSSNAGRVQQIEGHDFTWYFDAYMWAAMAFLGMTAGTGLGNQLGYLGANIPYIISQGLLGDGKPGDVAQKWLNFMLAPGGIIGQTRVPYRDGSTINLSDVMRPMFENYPDVYIPMAAYWIAEQGPWRAKFLDILPFPYYEFFVTTAPSGTYEAAMTSPSAPSAVGGGSTIGGQGPASEMVGALSLVGVAAGGDSNGGFAFGMNSMPGLPPAYVSVVGRVNPTPMVECDVSAVETTPTLGALDMTRWEKLHVYEMGGLNFTESVVRFSADAVRNFYQLNPTFYRALWGNNGNTVPFTYYFMGAGDPASIHRYGYHAAVESFSWMADPQGLTAQNPDANIPHVVAMLTGRLFSHWEPEPLMARAEVTMPLRPDILPGFRFRYSPFKGQPTWDFYIESISHSFTFGGRSATTLILCRGLPTTIYDDPADGGVLRAIHLGNAQRKPTVDGPIYQVGLPEGLGDGLTPFGQPDSIREFLGKIAPVYVTPQMK